LIENGRKKALCCNDTYQEFIMAKGNNSQKKETKKPKKEKPKAPPAGGRK
jgi:hypothetical protein